METSSAWSVSISDGAPSIVNYKTNPGECWMPFHYIEGGANWLTSDALDSISSTPEYKVCTVKVEKITA